MVESPSTTYPPRSQTRSGCRWRKSSSCHNSSSRPRRQTSLWLRRTAETPAARISERPVALQRRKTSESCHPERSRNFTKRGSGEVEGPLLLHKAPRTPQGLNFTKTTELLQILVRTYDQRKQGPRGPQRRAQW